MVGTGIPSRQRECTVTGEGRTVGPEGGRRPVPRTLGVRPHDSQREGVSGRGGAERVTL